MCRHDVHVAENEEGARARMPAGVAPRNTQASSPPSLDPVPESEFRPHLMAPPTDCAATELVSGGDMPYLRTPLSL